MKNIISSILKLPLTFWICIFITLLLLVFFLIDSTLFVEAFELINSYVFTLFGSFYLWFIYLTLIVFFLIGVSPLGKIKLGGKDATPDFSLFSWFSMLFCAGMGIGILFWGGAEPLYFFLNPPLVENNVLLEKESAAFVFSFFHWGFHPWAIYGLTTLAICFFGLNMEYGINFSNYILGKAKSKETFKRYFRSFIDIIVVLSILFGVVTSFGIGVVQFEGGLNCLFNVAQSHWLELLIVIFITVCYIISTLRGLNDGIKLLSNISMILCILLLLIVLSVFPLNKFISDFYQYSVDYIVNIPQLSIGKMPFENDSFLKEWTVKYWAWWIAWAPFVGIFISLISKGRTVRQLVFLMLLVPSIFSMIWFLAFGKVAIAYYSANNFLGGVLDFDNINLVLYKIIENISSSPIVSLLCLLLVSIFFINSADSATYTLAAITNTKNSDLIVKDNNVSIKTPPLILQISWGLLFSVLTLIFLFAGGLEVVQQISLLTALPFAFVLIIIFIKLIYNMVKYYRDVYRKDC